MKFIIGKKLNMTQVWQDEIVVPATKIQAGPCTIVQVKTKEKDGYVAVQVGFGERKKKNIKKPQRGHMASLGNFSHLREFALTRIATNDNSNSHELKRGDKIDVSTFEVGDKVKVSGVSKGKGFQGVVKRYGFKGTKATHGNKDQLRMPGSIGATGPAHVFKGQRMPGRMGDDNVTISNLKIIEVDKDNNTILVKGAVPGARNGILLIQGEGDLKVVSPKTKNDSKIIEEKSRDLKKDEDAKTKETAKNESPQKEENIEEVVVEAAEKVKGKEEFKEKDKEDKETENKKSQ